MHLTYGRLEGTGRGKGRLDEPAVLETEAAAQPAAQPARLGRPALVPVGVGAAARAAVRDSLVGGRAAGIRRIETKTV